MKVAVFGCGSLGSLMAFKLIRSGADVRIYQRPGVQYEALKANGILFVDREGRAERVSCKVTSKPESLGQADLALVLVKAYQTEEIAGALREALSVDGVALTLQNGLGNAEILEKELGAERVAAGTCTYGSHRLGPGEIAWGGDGIVRFGPWKPCRDLSEVTKTLDEAGIVNRLEPNPRKALWEKVILNASVNTVSALTRLRNGELLVLPHSVELMRHLACEGVEAARLAGEEIEQEVMWNLIRSVLEKTANNKTSMLQDVEAKRRTEAEAIVGRLVTEGRMKGRILERLETVYALIQSIDSSVDESRE
jgi:2-dehydropantoate 2-reductase